MFELLEKLCSFNCTSGNEDAVREFIISEIKDYCDVKTDINGNIIAFKKGGKSPLKKVMIDAHMDEVGLIITNITPAGFLQFSTVGGIFASSLIGRRVMINGIFGVIGSKPIHLLKDDAAKTSPEISSLYIDIGVSSRNEALEYVMTGDYAVVQGEFQDNGENILSKALDDRIGCAVLITLLKEKAEYDFYATFTCGEEVGLRGAKTAAFQIEPDCAIVLEATTASDIAGTSDDKSVCNLGKGPAVSFMDGATVYDRAFYNTALSSGIKCQAKRAVAGGNNSGSIHLSKSGVRTLAISAPCRYIHTASSMVCKSDIESMLDLARHMLKVMCEGNV